jgi:hypothetical protein
MRRIIFALSVSLMLFGSSSFGQSNLAIQGTYSSVCPGTSVTLYAIGGTAVRRWMPTSATSSFITVQPTVTTTYTLTSGSGFASYTINVCSDPSCQTSTVNSFNPFLLNTGNNGLTSTRTLGQTDLNWTYSTSINGTYVPAIVVDNTVVPGNYSKSIWQNTQWIGPNSSLSTIGSNYYYRLQFNLSSQDASNLVLNMQFMADNIVEGVTVNGVPLANSSTPGLSIYGFQLPNAVSSTMQGNWVAGLNTILVHVVDEGGSTGFIAQLSSTTTASIPTNITCPLPVKFLDFAVNSSLQEVDLIWTSQIDNGRYFLVQRSENNGVFVDIANIPIQEKESNNRTYSFVDKDIKGGYNYYYRVAAYDLDGTVSYSAVKLVQIGNTNTLLEILPNPNDGKFIVKGKMLWAESNGSFNVYSVTGEEVYSGIVSLAMSAVEYQFDFSYLPSGVYYFQIGNQPFKKLIKL